MLRPLCCRLFLAALLPLALACEPAKEAASPPSTSPSTAAPTALPANLPTTTHPNTNTDGWTPLFAPDLSNAVLQEPNSWAMTDGVLRARDRSTIWTQNSYDDFVLDLEFKVPPEGNSGVFLRTADTGSVLSALEVQIHETNDGSRHGEVGAVYDLLSPSQDAAKPAGEWNRYTITAYENRLFVVLNGVQVIDMDLNRWTEPNRNPDGERNKFDRAIRDQARSGPIGLQGIHGGGGQPVDFRNLKIKPL